MKLLTNRWIHIVLLLGLLLGAVYFSNAGDRWRLEMQYLVFDTLNQMHPREKSGDVIIVDIDDNSLMKIGQWPWPRTVIADLVESLSAMDAKVIAFDGLLAEPDRSSPRFVLESLPRDAEYQTIEIFLIYLKT